MKIVVWTGPAWETWGPGSLLTGIGGSETAAIHVSTELAKLGHEVEVVGQVTPCEYRGVRYVRYTDPLSPRECHRRLECDVFVSSRQLAANNSLKPDARLKVLWMHDVHVGPDNSDLMSSYDVVFCLSDWALQTARRFYPRVPEERFVKTRNGIDTRRFELPLCKDGWRVVYSSSPDRGLDKLLDYWPAVRSLRPDAELHVYYGFDTWEQIARRRGDDVGLMQIEIFRTRLANTEGVHSHGRVGQAGLARALLKASAWLYPTNFCETSCITAMEAMAAGAHSVTSRLGALPETAGFAHLVDPPNDREGYRAEFLARVERIARGDFYHEDRDLVTRGREWALGHLDWSGVARQWDEVFRAKTGVDR